MKINNLYNYKSLDRVTDENGSRYYVDPLGNKLTSVTTILSATADKSGLESWRNFVGEKKANQVRDEATGLGTLMHEHLENHMQGIPRPGGTNLVRQMARRMADEVISHGLKHVDEIWGIESPLYFPAMFAGTADLIGVHDGKPCIMDFKTTNKMKTADMIGDYFCQLAAYAMAHNHLYDTEINTGVIFMVSRDCKFQQFVITASDFAKAQYNWLERVDRFYSMEQKDQTS